jgi:tRNA modification GTPase
MDTIAAIATPPGRGGIGIVRISGAQVTTISQRLLHCLPPPRHALYTPFYDHNGHIIDQGLALYFPQNHSFTGEAVLELHGHGGTVVMDVLLQQVLALGARLARAGEFSERAFLNGKIDLVQAEAIADLIDSVSIDAARCAMRSLQGEFSNKIHALVKQLTELRCYIEAGIDFPDEEIDLLADGQVLQQVKIIQQHIKTVLGQAQQGHLLQEGINIVIIGQPNVGKSSLLNCLAGRETAIVTDIAGTTRDIIKDKIQIKGIPLHITDTAGLRQTNDIIEQEGIRRTKQAMQQADIVIFLQDDAQEDSAPDAEIFNFIPEKVKLLILKNKIDLTGKSVGFVNDHTLRISAKHSLGIDLLGNWLIQAVNYHQSETGLIMARRRHLDALERALAQMAVAWVQAQNQHSELLAEELRQTQQILGEITGEVTADDLLGQIFGSFCIGK